MFPGIVLAITMVYPFACRQMWAQQKLEHDFQNWDSVALTLPISTNNKTLLYLEIQPRIGNLDDLGSNNDFAQLILRSAAGYKLNSNVSVWQGYAWIPTFEPLRFNENRIFQQLLIENKHNRLNLTNRTRLEERWIEGTNGTTVRFRHQLKTSYPISKDSKWSLAGHDELFFTLKGVSNGPASGFDQNRAFLGVGRKLSEQVKTEIGYLNDYVNRRDPVADRMFHVIMLSLNIKIQ
jgi:hypothetical protein